MQVGFLTEVHDLYEFSTRGVSVGSLLSRGAPTG